jgi:hypothetical protein
MVSNKQYEELKDFYDKEIERLKTGSDYWRDRYIECVRHANEVDIYKSILAKQGILGEPNKYSDETFVFEGRIYRPTRYNLVNEPGRSIELIVDFVMVKED